MYSQSRAPFHISKYAFGLKHVPAGFVPPSEALSAARNDVSCLLKTDTFLADRTATQYDRLLASSCCPSVRLSVCDAVHSDSQGWCTGLKVAACS